MIFIIFTGIAVAQENTIPSWIKNIVVFWGDDKISDIEFINAMEYLIENDVITIESPAFPNATV